jgi:acyl carrier protein
MLRQLPVLRDGTSMNDQSMLQTIRRLIDEAGNLSSPAQALGVDADLYRAGLTPFAAIRLMLRLEKEFDVEFSKRMLNCRSLSSIASIRDCIRELEQRRALRKVA